LQQRQQQTLRAHCPELLDRVSWLDRLPEAGINGVVIANEVLDAMPVQRFVTSASGLQALGVAQGQQGLAQATRPADNGLQAQVRHLQDDMGVDFSVGYMSEINPSIRPWLNALAGMLDKGAVYIIDYGYPRAEYYLPERSSGTFMGYYRHRAFDDPLWYPGLQDMTAFVDFTAVAEAAVAAGFELEGFTSQGNFLLDCGLPELLQAEASDDEKFQLQQLQQMKTLTLNSEMGERFKVMALAMNMELPRRGFGLRDYLHRL
jgi:SAM-dependent MidA family methyltransferase